MKIRAKEHLEIQKKVTGDKLEARVFTLREKGLADAAKPRIMT